MIATDGLAMRGFERLVALIVFVALVMTACGSTGDVSGTAALSDAGDTVEDEPGNEDEAAEDEDEAAEDEDEEEGDDDEPAPSEDGDDDEDGDVDEGDDHEPALSQDDDADGAAGDREDEDSSDQGRADAPEAAPVVAVASGLGQASTWQPWEWDGWHRFPSLYFAAEPEGLLSNDQIDKIGQFSLAIIEFRAGQFVEEETSGEWAGGDLAGFMESQAAQVRSAHPDGPPVLTYRSGMWAGSMFAKQWEALQDQSLFIDDERLCDGFISYPKDVDESGFETDLQFCRWDFTVADARTVFLDLVADAAMQPSAGLFFDNAQSVVCDGDGEVSRLTREQRAELAVATQDLYREVFTTLVDNGKYPILSTTNRITGIGPQVPWESDCPLGEEALIEALDGVPFARNNEFWMWNLGELAINQVQNSIREAEAGIPLIVHMPWFSNDGGCLEGCRLSDGSIKNFTRDEFLEFGIAAFLVSMGPGSYFGFSDMQSESEGAGWFDESWEYYPQYDNISTGAPLGAADVSADGTTYTRQFENGTVTVNLADGSYELDLS